MHMNRRTVLGTALALGLGNFAAAGLSLAQGKGAPRKIILGQSVPLTGAASEIGLAFAAGAKLYVDSFNARKNNPGWTFELRQVDDGYDPAKATANAKKLLAVPTKPNSRSAPSASSFLALAVALAGS